MRQKRSRFASVAVAAALIVSSTASGAATGSAPAAQAHNPQSSWLTLSMLSPSASLGLAGAAAQPMPATNAPPPPPPPPGYVDNGVSGVPIPVIAIWLGVVAMAVYILTRDHDGEFIFPNSPD